MITRRLNLADFWPLILLQGFALWLIEPLWKALLVIPALMAVALPVVLYEREWKRRKAANEPTGWMTVGISLYFILMFLGLAYLHWLRAMEIVYGQG